MGNHPMYPCNSGEEQEHPVPSRPSHQTTLNLCPSSTAVHPPPPVHPRTHSGPRLIPCHFRPPHGYVLPLAGWLPWTIPGSSKPSNAFIHSTTLLFIALRTPINTPAEHDPFPYSFPAFLPVNASTSRAIKSSRDSPASASRIPWILSVSLGISGGLVQHLVQRISSGSVLLLQTLGETTSPCQLPKLDVAGSNPVSRSIFFYLSVLERVRKVKIASLCSQ